MYGPGRTPLRVVPRPGGVLKALVVADDGLCMSQQEAATDWLQALVIGPNRPGAASQNFYQKQPFLPVCNIIACTDNCLGRQHLCKNKF